MPSWAWAFLTATAAALAGTPVLRRLALASGLVDRPGRRKVHRRPVPYLGGVGLVTGVLAALLFEMQAAPRVAVLAVTAAGLGAIGLLDDVRTVHPGYRLLAEVLAAAIAVSAGLRIEASGVAGLDVVLTMLWIVGVTNAMNLLDNMDALAAGVAAVVAMAVFALAILGAQPVVATLAAAVAGACLGFLVYNRPPASIFMGDCGSLFLGFILAVLTITVSPSTLPPVSFLVPMLLMALPVLDTTTVILGRLRRGRSIYQGGRDHLSHRLVARGMRRRQAVVLLVLSQATLGLLAVLAGNGALEPTVTIGCAALVLGAIVATTSRARVYREPVAGFPATARRAVLGGLVALPLLSAPGLLALYSASGPAEAGSAAANRALDAFRVGDAAKTVAEFGVAARQLARAERRLSGPLVSVGLAVPIVSSNLKAARTLVSVGRDLSAVGSGLAKATGALEVKVEGGRVPLDRLQALTPRLTEAAASLRSAHRRVKGISAPFLAAPISGAARDLGRRLDREIGPTERAARAASLVPDILGADGTRRYFLAFQNNAELRGGGGFIGNWAELVAEGGRLRLERFGRLEELNEAGTRPRVVSGPPGFVDRWHEFNPVQFWQQVNVSPDFPTTGRVVSELYPQSGGRNVDGVIAVDPPGLAALLTLTGPVAVPGWPVPITSANVADVTLRAAYEAFPQDRRVEFLGDLSRRVAEAFTRADLGSPAAMAAALSRASRDGHLLVWLARAPEQRLVADVHADGAIPPLRGDSVLVVNQNIAGNKVDYYLRRTVRYAVKLDPTRRPAGLRARIEVTLRNDAPSRGLPQIVIGPYSDRFAAGENRTYLSVYTPFAQRAAAVGGAATKATTQGDLGRQAQSVIVSIPSEQARTLELDVEGRLELTPDGWYRLDLLHQTTLFPDDVEVTIEVPRGWRIAEGRGFDRSGEKRATVQLRQDRAHTILVRVERTGWARIWEQLTRRP